MGKKILYAVILFFVVILTCLSIRFSLSSKLKLGEVDKSLKWEIKYKGLKKARDFTFDSNGDCFIAFKNKIQYINNKGKSYEILKDDKLDINSIVEKNDVLYFASTCSIFSFDLATQKMLEIIADLPNFGDYNKSIIRLSGEDIYVSIGAATNSGVVGEDNLWLKSNKYNCDISPYDITLNPLKVGGFVPFKSKNIKGQNISGHFPGNASIIKLNIRTKESKNFAWGIRNVLGMDFDSGGRLYAAVGGMEDRGLRPIKNDLDYIYEIKQDKWYGWPDFTGGDPINSPRFQNSKTPFILEKPPTLNPTAPFYQHKNLDGLSTLAVDKMAILGEKDNIYFYDKKDKSIYVYNSDGSIINLIRFSENSEIVNIKFVTDYLYILDSGSGCFIQIRKNLP